MLKNVIKSNSHHAHNVYPNLNDQQQFRLNKITDIEDFIAEIKERELMCEILSKYIASFEYFDKSLTVLSVRTASISIASFATVIGAPVETVSTKFSLPFSIFYRNCEKTFKNNKKLEEKA